MATITLDYDDKDLNAKNALDLLFSLNLIRLRKEKKPKKSGIDLALEDVRKGRVYTAKNTKDLMKQTVR
jgi:hypothetical protein